jgi:hypothetical protein
MIGETSDRAFGSIEDLASVKLRLIVVKSCSVLCLGRARLQRRQKLGEVEHQVPILLFQFSKLSTIAAETILLRTHDQVPICSIYKDDQTISVPRSLVQLRQLSAFTKPSGATVTRV